MSDDRVKLAEERKLIFANLVNGASIDRVMIAFQKSEREVTAIFDFVSRKVRSYRFERGMPFAACDTIDAARRNAAIILHTLERLNLAKDPLFDKIETYAFDPTTPGLSDGERKMIEFQSRRASR